MPRKSQVSQGNATQHTLEESFGGFNENIDEQVNDVIRYIIFRGGENATFSKSEFQKQVIPRAGKNFEEIMVKVGKILRTVYEYNWLVVNSTHRKAKGYIVSNALEYIKDPTEIEQNDEGPDDKNKILLMLILSHIYMNNNLTTDGSLYAFLKSLKLDVELRHPIFGNLKEYINRITKEHYIISEIDSISRRHTFSWGHKAEKEISKHNILKFVCKMYKDRTPTSWENQYKVAHQQNLQKHHNITEGESSDQPMDVEQ